MLEIADMSEIRHVREFGSFLLHIGLLVTLVPHKSRGLQEPISRMHLVQSAGVSQFMIHAMCFGKYGH